MPPSQSSQPRSQQSTLLRVGDCRVDIPLREITRADGSTTRVTVKSMSVLTMLAAHPGQVVSRDSLLKSVWAGTLPTDDVLTQAVTALRKAFGDGRGEPAYVETIPKAGYRLLAPVEWMPVAPDPKMAARAWLRPVASMLGVAVLALLGWGVTRQSGPAASSPQLPAAPRTDTELPYSLLTSRVGRETQPALSPDGAQVAYAMPPGEPGDPPAIFVQATQPTSARQLTTPPPGSSDHLPRWSPDGRQLMFTRIDDTGACVFHLVPVSGGAVRAVGSCDRVNGRYDWLAGGDGIVAGIKPGGEGEPGPLSVLHLDTGQWQPMPYAIAASEVDFDPRVSPDGSQIAFRRNRTRSDLWQMPVGGGSPRQLTHLRGSISGWDWEPGGRSLLLGTVGNPSKLYRHDLASGTTRALGRFQAAGLDLAALRNIMVFAVDDARIAMFRYPLPLRAGASAQAVFASTGTDLLPSPSPDGRQLAFYSDRSREARLWLGEPDNPEQLRMIDGITPIARHPSQWSADGRRLLVIGEAPAPDGVTAPRLYEVDVASGRATTLELEDAPYFAQYLPGGRLLLVVDRGAGQLSMRIVDATTTPMRTLAQLDDVGEARFDAAGEKLYFVRSDKAGLWRSGVDLEAPEQVDANLPAGYWLRRWTVLDGRPLAVRTAAPECLAEWHWFGGAEEPGAVCLDRERRAVPSLAPVPSQDRKWLYASMVVGMENSDIGLIEFEAPRGAVRAQH